MTLWETFWMLEPKQQIFFALALLVVVLWAIGGLLEVSFAVRENLQRKNLWPDGEEEKEP